jgi:hypothetical protein
VLDNGTIININLATVGSGICLMGKQIATVRYVETASVLMINTLYKLQGEKNVSSGTNKAIYLSLIKSFSVI